jgi:hypothetical protein
MVEPALTPREMPRVKSAIFPDAAEGGDKRSDACKGSINANHSDVIGRRDDQAERLES